jgi:hypothetical protein
MRGLRAHRLSAFADVFPASAFQGVLHLFAECFSSIVGLAITLSGAANWTPAGQLNRAQRVRRCTFYQRVRQFMTKST